MTNPFTRSKTTRFLVKTPTIHQMDAAECGPASLAIILAYYGKWISLEKLRSDCGVSRDGSKASNILRAARAYELVAKGFKKEVPQLKQMPAPFIVFWNFNHYIVIEGFTKKGVFANDPSDGRKVFSYEEFDEGFTGVVLTFEKESGFQKEGAPPRTMQSLKARMHGTSLPLMYLLIASLIGVIPGMANAGYSRLFLDNILVDGMWSWLSPLVIAMSATTLLMLLLGFLHGWVTLKFQTKLSISGSAKYFWHTLRLPSDFFAQRYSADIGSRVSINDTVAAVIATQLSGGVLNALMVVFYAIVMFKYDIFLTLLGILMSVSNLFILRLLSRRSLERGRRLVRAKANLMLTTILGLQSIETIKASGTESEFFARWAGYQAGVLSLDQQLASSSLALSAIPGLLAALNGTALLCLGGLRVMDGILSIGMLITFQALMGSFTTPVSGLMDLGSQLQMMQNRLGRLDDVLNQPVDKLACSFGIARETGVTTGMNQLGGSLELKDVVFGYNHLDKPLLVDISIKIEPGQRVALVGGSGSGKSTIARIVAGINHQWSGEILFDSKTRTEYDRAVICNSVACIDQEIILFDGTIRENITLWDDTISEARAVKAAKDAGIHDFITTLKGDYSYLVEEGGRNFSGGQRQRIEIARALISHPSILVLDEATSALDPMTEKIVMDNIRRLGCSCLIVAHRLSTIRDCDEIIVLQQGRIVQRGTHEEMARLAGPYAKLLDIDVNSSLEVAYT